ncbi:MAG: Heparinase II/III-like protein [Planctomycetes bacterium ADurb.Bin126]|nr:MAG: Heparinase II/III-like protein [Planctomycetes bacterium ADurb.Bin126]HOD82171.1 heparinase II/III family protein [Phycisphaerae bacterium]HQL75616.1 heparinase II/III family protein [Phycisphaerae bacterium]
MMSRSRSVLIGVVLLLCPLCAQAADLLPPADAIRRDRPRLLLTPTDLPAGQAGAPLAISLGRLKAPPDAQSAREYSTLLAQVQGLRKPAALALAWRLTGKAETAQKAVDLLKSWRMDGGKARDPFYVYFTLWDLALAYDWLHDFAGFDEQARSDLRRRALPLAETGVKSGNDHVFHNYVWMFNGGAMMWALATVGEDPAADKMYATLRDRFNRELYGAMRYLAGGNGDSGGYWWLYCHNSAVMVLLAAQSATGQDLVAAVKREHGDWLARQYDYLLLSILPDLRFIPWGDTVAGPNGGITHEMAEKIDALAWALRSSPGAYVSRWLASKRGPARYYGETAIFYFLYGRDLPAHASPPPLGMLAGDKNGGQAIFRSGWDEGSTVVGFRCTDFFGQHNHLDQGSFILYRNGLLALDAGRYQKVAGPPMATDAHNTLLIAGKGQRTQRYQSAATLDAFLSRLPKGLETGEVLFYKDAGPWAAITGQFAQAYDPQIVLSAVRQLLYVRPEEPGGVDRVVIVDRLAGPAGKSLGEVRWLLHVPAKPTVEGLTVTATNGKSYLRCRPVGPAAPRVLIEEGLRTPAGRNWAMIDTSRVVYACDAGERLTLVHVLEMGDGQPPAKGADARFAASGEAVLVILNGKAYRFETARISALMAE